MDDHISLPIILLKDSNDVLHIRAKNSNKKKHDAITIKEEKL